MPARPGQKPVQRELTPGIGQWQWEDGTPLTQSEVDELGLQNAGNAGNFLGDVGTAIGIIPKTLDENAPGSELDTSGADAQRQRMQGLLEHLQQQAATGTGAWEQTLAEATSRAQATAQSLGQSNPNVSYGSALDNIGNAQASAGQRSVVAGDRLRAQTQMEAQDALGGLLAGQTDADVAQAAEQARVRRQRTQTQMALNDNALKTRENIEQGIAGIFGMGGMANATQSTKSMSDGGAVPGRAPVFGDDERNDTVPAMLSPGEIVVPRTKADDPDAAADFARAVAERGGAQGLAGGGQSGGRTGEGFNWGYLIEPHLGRKMQFDEYNKGLTGEPTVENGSLLDLGNYQQGAGQLDALIGTIQQRGMGGGPSVAPGMVTSATDDTIEGSMRAQQNGMAAADAVKRAAVASANAGAEAAAARAGEQSGAARGAGSLMTRRRSQEQTLAGAAQRAAWEQTLMNAGLSLEQQRQLQGLASGIGQAAQAYSSAGSTKGLGGGGDDVGDVRPFETNDIGSLGDDSDMMGGGDEVGDDRPSQTHDEPGFASGGRVPGYAGGGSVERLLAAINKGRSAPKGKGAKTDRRMTADELDAFLAATRGPDTYDFLKFDPAASREAKDVVEVPMQIRADEPTVMPRRDEKRALNQQGWNAPVPPQAVNPFMEPGFAGVSGIGPNVTFSVDGAAPQQLMAGDSTVGPIASRANGGRIVQRMAGGGAAGQMTWPDGTPLTPAEMAAAAASPSTAPTQRQPGFQAVVTPGGEVPVPTAAKPFSAAGVAKGNVRPVDDDPLIDFGSHQALSEAAALGVRPRGQATTQPPPSPTSEAQPTTGARPVARGADYGLGDARAAMTAEQAALKARGEAEAEQARGTAAALGELRKGLEANALEEKRVRETARMEAQHIGAQRDALAAELKKIDTSVDPGRYWASRDTGQRVLGIIGLALGAFGGARDGVNKAALMMGTAIDRDIEAQKATAALALQKGQQSASALDSLYGRHRQLYQDDLSATAAAKATALELADNQVKQVAATAASPIAKANAMQLSAQLQMQIAKFKSDAASKAEEQRHHLALETSKATGAGGLPAAEVGKVNEVRERAATIRDNIALAKALIDKSGTFELVGTEETELRRALKDIAQDAARMKDPNSTVKEQEMLNAIKSLGVEGGELLTRNSTAKKLLESFEATIDTREDEALRVRGLPTPQRTRR